MRIRHIFPTTSARDTVSGERAFFSRNQTGDFLYFFTTRQTRYEGWYLQQDRQFIKIIERIGIASPVAISGITTTGQCHFIEYENSMHMGYKLVPGRSGLTVNASQPVPIQITLDTRAMYDQPQFGRQYKVTTDKEGYLIRYRDETLAGPVYLHLRSTATLQLKQEWQPQSYPRDEKRHSPPAVLYTYFLGTITTDFLAFGAGRSAGAAREASLAASKQRLQPPQTSINYTHDTLPSHVSTAKAAVTQALRYLQTEEGIYAGLPWFHQVWSRDELIASLGYSKEDQKEVIEQYLGHPLVEGELPTYIGSGTTCADGVGWLCLLVREYGEQELSQENRERLLRFLDTAHTQLKQYRQAGHGLIISGHNATWMDTIGRSGFRIEIQCMYGLLLELLYALTGEAAYEQEHLRFLGTVKQMFWEGSYLRDGLADPSIRPNIFLAYLLQPALLNRNSWQLCFDTALSHLQAPWGGLASLDTKNPGYQPESTGEDNRSYHNGDSWFFINNLAATALHRFDSRRYGAAVVDILQSSTREILFEHMIGQPGEISSGSQMDSYGCGIQAFSGGTYLALLRELEGYGKQDRDSMAFFWGPTAASTAAN
ncbi:hypothetical protein KGQ71_00960 [Patescibacteria group bacterium]|nr:hypothetical protein [Patescibacteria group bacterium]